NPRPVARSRRGSFDATNPRAQAGDRPLGHGLAPGRAAYLLDCPEDVVEARGLQRQDAARAAEQPAGLAHLRIADRADLAELLGEDQVGIEALQQRLVDVVD